MRIFFNHESDKIPQGFTGSLQLSGLLDVDPVVYAVMGILLFLLVSFGKNIFFNQVIGIFILGIIIIKRDFYKEKASFKEQICNIGSLKKFSLVCFYADYL